VNISSHVISHFPLVPCIIHQIGEYFSACCFSFFYALFTNSVNISLHVISHFPPFPCIIHQFGEYFSTLMVPPSLIFIPWTLPNTCQQLPQQPIEIYYSVWPRLHTQILTEDLIEIFIVAGINQLRLGFTDIVIHKVSMVLLCSFKYYKVFTMFYYIL